jgi:hypothetical protein
MEMDNGGTMDVVIHQDYTGGSLYQGGLPDLPWSMSIGTELLRILEIIILRSQHFRYFRAHGLQNLQRGIFQVSKESYKKISDR